MIWQHDAAGADANGLRSAGDMRDHDRGRGAGNAGKIVMFRYPIAMITPTLGVLGKVERVAKSKRGVAAFDNWREIEQRKIFHG